MLNTPLGRAYECHESAVRARAVALGAPVITTVAAAVATVSAMGAPRRGPLEVPAPQERP